MQLSCTISSTKNSTLTTLKIEKRTQRIMIIFIMFYLTVAHGKLWCTSSFMKVFWNYLIGTGMPETLACYSCSGGEKCGKLFSPNSTNVKIVKSMKNESLRSCSVRMIILPIDVRHECFFYFCHSDNSNPRRFDDPWISAIARMSQFVLSILLQWKPLQ
jgi:hypothetical protein